jgi:hypothetical protein
LNLRFNFGQHSQTSSSWLTKKKINSQNNLPPKKKQKLEEKTTHKEVELTEDILEAVSPIYAKPTLDFTFKKLFGNDQNKALTNPWIFKIVFLILQG